MRAEPLALFTVLVVFAATAPAAPAHAADQAGARAAFEEAERQYQLGRFPEAIAAYERAYSLDPQAAFLFNIALAHRRQFEIDGQLEHLRRARELYRNYLRLEPTTPRRAAVERLIEDLGSRLARDSPGPSPQPGPPALSAPPPPPPAIVATTPAPPPPRRAATGWWILGGAVLAAAAGTVAFVMLRNRHPESDGPLVDLGGTRR
jgi:tetratricopeptide (TPR) repeat protein